MLKRFLLLASLCHTLSNNANAQHLTRLIGYEEFTKDSSGAPVHYHAYWQKFSGNRGSTIAWQVLAGWSYDGLFVDASAPDTIYVVNRQYTPGGYNDSFMHVFSYDSSTNTRINMVFSWNAATSSWKNYAGSKDSFNITSGQLTTSYRLDYDTSTHTFNYAGHHAYTYNSSGQLTTDLNYSASDTNKQEYTWSGNDLLSVIDYHRTTGTWEMVGWRRSTTYVSSRRQNHSDELWYDFNGIPTYSGGVRDSNTYTGNTLTSMYTHLVNTGSPDYFNARHNYLYDANGNIIQTIVQLKDTFGTWYNSTKQTVSYDSYNNPLLVEDSTWTAGKWKFTWDTGPYELRYHYEGFPASIGHLSMANISIYPSPAQNTIHVRTVFSKETSCTIAITDMQGRLLLQRPEQIPPGGSEVTLPVSALANGNYLLQISSQEETSAKQFCIAR